LHGWYTRKNLHDEAKRPRTKAIKNLAPPQATSFFCQVTGRSKKIHDKIFPEHIPGHITCPEDYYLVKKRMGEYLKINRQEQRDFLYGGRDT